MNDKDVAISKKAVLDLLQDAKEKGIVQLTIPYIEGLIENLQPVKPDVLADMLMEERIRGELKQDIFYSKDVIDNVRCKLTVEIIDRRPCYCGAELREVWRERKDSEE